jgi:hypothetical protein
MPTLIVACLGQARAAAAKDPFASPARKPAHAAPPAAAAGCKRKLGEGGGEGGGGRPRLTSYDHTLVMRRGIEPRGGPEADTPFRPAWPL